MVWADRMIFGPLFMILVLSVSVFIVRSLWQGTAPPHYNRPSIRTPWTSSKNASPEARSTRTSSRIAVVCFGE